MSAEVVLQPHDSPREGSSMFAEYLSAQRQQQHLEKQMKQKDKGGRLLRMQQFQHGRRVGAAEEIALNSNDACAELQLMGDSDDDEDEEENVAAAVEESVIAARRMQLSRGRRSNIQDALIHRLTCYSAYISYHSTSNFHSLQVCDARGIRRNDENE
jgi:hypothetical protein